jgi:hypothetical protein
MAGEKFSGFAGFNLRDLLTGGGPVDPGYSATLEAGLAFVLRDMTPERKLALARRMLPIFRELEKTALADLGEADGTSSDLA